MLQRMRAAKRQESGFTLIELLIVVVILGILAAIVVFAVNGVQDRGTASACETDVETVTSAAEAFDAENGRYPLSMDKLVRAGFLHSIPTSDTYRIDYLASNNADGGSLSVSSAFCPGLSASPPTTSPSSSYSPVAAYCDELRSPQNNYSALVRSFYQTNSNVRGMALGNDLVFLDTVSSEVLMEQFQAIRDLAVGDQRSDWQTFHDSFDQVRQVLAGSGLRWGDLPALYHDELPGGLSQEQAQQLQFQLQQPLNAADSLTAGRAIGAYARGECGISLD